MSAYALSLKLATSERFFPYNIYPMRTIEIKYAILYLLSRHLMNTIYSRTVICDTYNSAIRWFESRWSRHGRGGQLVLYPWLLKLKACFISTRALPLKLDTRLWRPELKLDTWRPDGRELRVCQLGRSCSSFLPRCRFPGNTPVHTIQAILLLPLLALNQLP